MELVDAVFFNGMDRKTGVSSWRISETCLHMILPCHKNYGRASRRLPKTCLPRYQKKKFYSIINMYCISSISIPRLYGFLTAIWHTLQHSFRPFWPRQTRWDFSFPQTVHATSTSFSPTLPFPTFPTCNRSRTPPASCNWERQHSR